MTNCHLIYEFVKVLSAPKQGSINHAEKFNEDSDLSLMGVLASSDGEPKYLQNLDSDVFQNGRFWADISIDYPQFKNMKSLQKWIKLKN